MGDAIVWAAIVSLLSVFNFTKAKDEAENEVEIPEPYFVDGVIRYKSDCTSRRLLSLIALLLSADLILSSVQ
jgi:hypothetical protein